LKAVEDAVRDGWYYDLIKWARNEKLPEKFRDAAREGIEPAKMNVGMGAVEDAVRDQKFDKLIRLAEDLEVCEKARIIAGKAVVIWIRHHKSLGHDSEHFHDLIKWARNEKLPEKVRETAGMNAIGITVDVHWLSWEVIKLAEDPKLPKKVREFAGPKAVENAVKEGRIQNLIKLAENGDLPEIVREAARKGIDLVGLKAIEKAVKEGKVHDLMEWAGNENLPEKFREAAREAALVIKKELTNRAALISSTLGLTPKNPLAGDGIKSEVRSGFGKKPKKEEQVRKGRVGT
jgi:hypothetical protein